MDDVLLEKARRLKSEGYNYEKIRAYLSGAGYDKQTITSAFRLLDEEEIHQLYQKQQITQLKIGAFISLVPSVLGIAYTVYEYVTYQSISVIFLLPLGFLYLAYRNYQRIREKRFTTNNILKEEKKKVSWRNNY